MTKQANLFLFVAIISAFIISSCKKEGCTDPDSVTYNEDAKKDDGTCRYQGEAIIWYGQATSIGLQGDGATSLTYYVDGEIVGSSATSVYWTNSPECGQSGSVTITKDLGGNKSQAYTYTVQDQTGYVYWTGVINFNANSCFAVELVW